MHRFANPTRFLKLAAAVLPFSAAIAILCIGAGLVMGLVFSPADYQQGDTVRIMYVHVPAASLAMGIYVGIAISGAISLIWRHAVADLIAKASAPVGAVFAAICLVTGAIWGEPTWGTWWVWDARLTSMLILFFIYIGYMAMWAAYDDPARAGRATSILALATVVIIPVIKFSVEWWNTLHQPASILKAGGPSIDPAMLWPLALMFVGQLALYITIMIYRVRAEVDFRRIRAIQMAMAFDHGNAGSADNVPDGATAGAAGRG